MDRQRALQLLDWRSEDVGGGGRQLQEEYIEWRVVRTGTQMSRVELTTELSEYWRVLAAYEPETLVETVADFARESAVPTEAVYGACDPYADGITPNERERSFAGTMLPPDGRSAYNNGERALCFMTQSTNSLGALVMLAAAALDARLVHIANGGARCLTCWEAIPLLRGAAQLGRASDSILVERLARLAFERRLVALDDPVGVYIQSVEHTRLRTPTGAVVPPDWFTFGRGISAEMSPDARPRYQRLTFEVPPEEGFSVGDLVDVATEQPIRHGGQVADLVQLAVFLRVGESGTAAVDRAKPAAVEAAVEDAEGCARIRNHEQRFTEFEEEA
ncbi:MAG: hypothetical protein WEB06_06015 [Actinomycetota bacterium]